MPNDLRTRALILRRTNYGESDRILTLLTPEGKISALAKGVRKEKSRLAGGIELFSVTDVVVHQGHSDLAILTSAKMLEFFGNIMADMSRLELAASFLKRLDRASEQVNNPDFFTILYQALQALHQGTTESVVSTWFNLNLYRANGEELNFVRDVSGESLSPDLTYHWDLEEGALRPHPKGSIGASEIKLARLMLEKSLTYVTKISQIDQIITPIAILSKQISP